MPGAPARGSAPEAVVEHEPPQRQRLDGLELRPVSGRPRSRPLDVRWVPTAGRAPRRARDRSGRGRSGSRRSARAAGSARPGPARASPRRGRAPGSGMWCSRSRTNTVRKLAARKGRAVASAVAKRAAGTLCAAKRDLRQMQVDADPSAAAHEADEVVALAAPDLERRLLDQRQERRQQRVLGLREAGRAGRPAKARVVRVPEVAVLRRLEARIGCSPGHVPAISSDPRMLKRVRSRLLGVHVLGAPAVREAPDPHGRRLALALVVLAPPGSRPCSVHGTRRSRPTRRRTASSRGTSRAATATRRASCRSIPAPYDSVRHLPDLHGLLTPVLLAPLFALQGGGAAAVRMPSTLAVPRHRPRRLRARRGGCSARRRPSSRRSSCSPARASSSTRASATDDTGFAFLATAMIALLTVAVHERRPGLLVGAGLVAGVAILRSRPASSYPRSALVALLVLRRTTRVSAGAVLGLARPPVLAFGVYLAAQPARAREPRLPLRRPRVDMEGLGLRGDDGALRARAVDARDRSGGLGPARVLEITGEQFA